MDGVITPLLLSLKIAGGATLAALVTAIPAGFVFARRRFPGKDLADAFLTLPMVMPPTVLGYYLLTILGVRGVFGAWLWEHFGIRLIFTIWAAVIAATAVAFPLVFKSARAAFESPDRNAEDAARTLGKTEAEIFFRVTLPLARRGILAGALLAFARSLGEFGATLMVAGSIPGETRTISIEIYEAMLAGEESRVGFLVAVTSLAGVAALFGASRLVRANDASGGGR